jgi:hypothetical protein
MAQSVVVDDAAPDTLRRALAKAGVSVVDAQGRGSVTSS